MSEIRSNFYAPGTGVVITFVFYETDGETEMSVADASSYKVYIKRQGGEEVERTAEIGSETNEIDYTVASDDFTPGEYTLHAEPVGLGGVTMPSSPAIRLDVKSRHQA